MAEKYIALIPAYKPEAVLIDLLCELCSSGFECVVGIGIGTIVLAVVNGSLIGGFGKIIDKFFEIKPLFPNFAKKFDI